MDNRLQRIANILMLNSSFLDSLGLLNGKMGIAVFFCQYACFTNNKIFEDYAEELIDEIYEELNINTPIDFENGLTGIGWGIEYLVKNGFVEADTNEVLAEIDDAVYKSNIYQSILINNKECLCGYGFYYASRLRGRVNRKDYTCTLLIKKIKDLIEFYKSSLSPNQNPILDFQKGDIESMNSIIWLLLEIYRLGLFPEEINKVLSKLLGYMESVLIISQDFTSQAVFYRLIENIILVVNDISLKKAFKTFLKNEKSFVNSVDASDDLIVTNFSKNAWHQLVYQPYWSETKLLQDQARKISKIIDNEDNWDKRLENLNKDNMGLTGLAGLGLGLMYNCGKEII